MKMKFDKNPLAREQKNYKTKIVNPYIVYDLDNWSKIPLRIFTLKNCLFGATAIVKKSNKEKWVYNGYGIAFDGKSSWSFGDDYARNVVIFDVDASSSSHADNRKNKFSINFSMAKTKFCLSLHYNGDNSYLFINEKEIYKFKVSKRKDKIPTWFCLRSTPDGFHATKSREVSLGGNAYDF